MEATHKQSKNDPHQDCHGHGVEFIFLKRLVFNWCKLLWDFPKQPSPRWEVRAGSVDGMNCPATRTSKHLPTQPQSAAQTKNTDALQAASAEQQHLSVRVRKTNQPCTDRAGVLPHLLPFNRETNAYRYLWSWKGTTQLLLQPPTWIRTYLNCCYWERKAR